MQKLFSVFFLIFITSSVLFGQAVVDIPLLATDGSVPTPIEVAVGLDLTATNGIDVGLGEAVLPPLAPGLDVRFDLAPYGQNATTYKDYRAPGNPPEFPFSGSIQHTIILQHSNAGLAINIDYNIPLNAEMTITDQIGGSFLNLGPFTGVGVATIPGTYLDIFTKAFLVMNYTDITPVELTSFNASVLNEGVILNWTTATELNNQGFEIERSSNINNWEKIGYVPGYGTTSEPKSYSFLDENVTTGKYTYRLKQIDFDGTINYSPEVVINIEATPSNYTLSQNYPNPFNPSTSIHFQVPKQSDVSIIVYDMLGQEVKELFAGQAQAGSYTVQWDGSSNSGLKMSSGSYIYRMSADGFIETKEMILLK